MAYCPNKIKFTVAQLCVLYEKEMGGGWGEIWSADKGRTVFVGGCVGAQLSQNANEVVFSFSFGPGKLKVGF